MTADRNHRIVPEDEKAYHRIVAKSWLDSTLRDALRGDPAKALGVTRLTADEITAVSRFLDEDIEHPQPPVESGSAVGRKGPSDLRSDSFHGFDAGEVNDGRSAGGPSNIHSAFSMELPRLAAHFSVRAEPADPSGKEVLHFVSSRRALRFEGRNLPLFHDAVLPLLDGCHPLDALEAAQRAGGVFCLEASQTVGIPSHAMSQPSKAIRTPCKQSGSESRREHYQEMRPDLDRLSSAVAKRIPPGAKTLYDGVGAAFAASAGE